MQETEPKHAKAGVEAASAIIETESPRSGRGGRPTRAAAEALDRRILDVAASLFASQGFAATSMEQIASECHAGKDTIYRRYPSKASLFSTLMETLRTRIVSELDAHMESAGAPADRLRRYARSLLEINLRPDLIALRRVALSEAIPIGGVQPTPVAQDPFMSRFAVLVKEAQADGVTMKGDPLFIAEQLLYATSVLPANAAMLGEDRFADPAEQNRYFNRAWDLFFSGASPRD